MVLKQFLFNESDDIPLMSYAPAQCGGKKMNSLVHHAFLMI